MKTNEANDRVFRLRNVSKRYPHPEKGTVEVLRRITLDIGPGMTAILGPSGSGKSTLLHLLKALDPPTGGEVYFNGGKIDYTDPQAVEHVRSRIALVFQENNLIGHLTILENAALPLLLQGVHRRVALTQAKEWLGHFGLGDQLHKRPAALSGGQRQRAGIARAFVTRADAILADEPTGNLDCESGLTVMQAFRNVALESHTPVVLVTHNTGLAREFCDWRITLRDGQVCSDGIPLDSSSEFDKAHETAIL